MGRLLRFNFRKLIRQRSMYICIGVMALLLGFTGLMYVLMKNMLNATGNMANAMTGMDQAMAMLGNQITDVGFGLSGVTNSNMGLIVGIITAVAVCDDYEQRTYKTIFGRGYTRTQAYFAKYIAVFCAAAACFVVVMAFAFGLGAALFGAKDMNIAKLLPLLGAQLLALLAQTTMAYLLSSLFKRTGVSIVAVVVIPTVMDLIMQVMDYFLQIKGTTIMDYWLSSFYRDLSYTTVSTERIITCAALSVGYMALFLITGAIANRKVEV